MPRGLQVGRGEGDTRIKHESGLKCLAYLCKRKRAIMEHGLAQSETCEIG